MKKHIVSTFSAFAITTVLSLAAHNTHASDAVKESATVVEKAGEMAGVKEKININTASVEMLEKIPGIGPTIGSAIETYRNANGAFKSLGDLTKVEGIDASLLEKIKPFLSI